MRFELRRWWFGSCVATALLFMIGAQWPLDWNLRWKSGPPGVRGAQASNPAAPTEGLAEAIRAVETRTDADAVTTQRAQQRLIDEARRGPVAFHRAFADRLDAVEMFPARSTMALLEAFFLVADDTRWGPVARFLERIEDAESAPTSVSLRARIFRQLRRRPPSPTASTSLLPALTRLVEVERDLPVAREAAEAFLALHDAADRDAAREQLRKLVERRPSMEQLAFADLYQ